MHLHIQNHTCMGKKILPSSSTMPMARATATFLVVLFLCSAGAGEAATNLVNSDLRALLRLRRFLQFPPALTPFPASPCSVTPSSSLRLSCDSSGHLSALHLAGPLPTNVSLPSVLPILLRLPFLSSLSLPSLPLVGSLPSSLPTSLTFLNLSSNLLSGPLPDLSNLTQLSQLDLSGNLLSSIIPASLLALPNLTTLDLSGNDLTSVDPSSSCGPRLAFVNLSGNPLGGNLPTCIPSNTSREINHNSGQKPLAANVTAHNYPHGSGHKLGIILGTAIGSATLSVALVAAVLLKIRSRSKKKTSGIRGLQHADALADAKRRAEEAKIGAFAAAPYRVFEKEEVEEMTGGFDAANLLKDHGTGPLYRGWLHDGTTVTIKRLGLKQKLSRTSLRQFTDSISKLRHRHLVSVLGHCVVEDDTKDTVVCLVLESFSNGTLRSHLTGTDWRRRETLKWPQRVASVLGVARGIQFLHNYGIYGNNIGMDSILMDEALTTKISNYTLPIPDGNKNNKVTAGFAYSGLGGRESMSNQNIDNGSKEDIYQLGLILQEIITGKSASTEGELEILKLQLQRILTESITELHKLVDNAIQGTFTYDSLRTSTEVALSCLEKEQGSRPSIDDVLWHLQYSIQVQYACASSGSISVQSFSIAT